MRSAAALVLCGLLAGCVRTGGMSLCEYTDRRVDWDEVGPQGLTAEELVDGVGTRVFTVAPDEDYGPEWSEPLADLGALTLSARRSEDRPYVRTWEPRGACFLPGDEDSFLHAPAELTIDSADGALAVEGTYNVMSYGQDDVERLWTWTSEHMGAQGTLPGWLEAQIETEHAQYCPGAGGDVGAWVMPSESVERPRLSVEARYDEHGVCSYAALMAIGRLEPIAR